MFQLSTIVFDLVVAMLVIAVLWIAGLRFYQYLCLKFYKRGGVDISENKDDTSKKSKLLRLFFYRQQTYEYSAYAILVLCILFLMACICIFLFANEIVIQTSDKHDWKGNEFIISSISLRIGISFVVFFICQVLLRLYRYCLRYGGFYLGLFDSLYISEEIKMDLQETVKLFMPKIDVGKDAPKSPSEDIIEMLKNLKDIKPG